MENKKQTQTNMENKKQTPSNLNSQLNSQLNLYQKLAKARSVMGKVERSGKNTFSKNKYTTLEDLYALCIDPLIEAGLYLYHEIVQEDCLKEDGEQELVGDEFYLVTRIIDTDSLKSITSRHKLTTSLDIQKQGAQITYYKRYHISSLLAIRSDADDDGVMLVNGPPNSQLKFKERITKAQTEELVSMISKLQNGDRVRVFKAIGTGEVSSIEKSKFKSIKEFIGNILMQNGGNL